MTNKESVEINARNGKVHLEKYDNGFEEYAIYLLGDGIDHSIDVSFDESGAEPHYDKYPTLESFVQAIPVMTIEQLIESFEVTDLDKI